MGQRRNTELLLLVLILFSPSLADIFNSLGLNTINPFSGDGLIVYVNSWLRPYKGYTATQVQLFGTLQDPEKCGFRFPLEVSTSKQP